MEWQHRGRSVSYFHPMPNAKRTTVLLLAAALTACGSAPSRVPPRAAAPSAAYDNTPDWLRQAESAIAAGDARAADQALARVNINQLPPSQNARFQLTQARVYLLQNQPQLAERALPDVWSTGDRRLAAQIEWIRSEAQLKNGDPVAATSTLVQREALLDRGEALTRNRERIWSQLMQAPLDQRIESSLHYADPVTRGWVELARITRTNDGLTQSNALADWRIRYPNHPGELSMADTGGGGVWQPAPGPLGSVALLLPLSGRYAAPAEAVREGFFAAWLQTPQPRPTVQVFDSGDSIASFDAAYREALASRAGFIVGPLEKEQVQRLVQMAPNVPALALNYLDGQALSMQSVFQFGLAPEDEARQAAIQAVAAGQSRAIALIPEGSWGDRVYSAFAEKLAALGGSVLQLRRFNAAQSDFSDQIQDLLSLRQSRERDSALRGIIGVSTEFEPRPRADIDFAFVAAGPTQARSIRSQFRYFHASSLPIYATSIAYDGRVDPAADLSGLRFCDMPWMIDSNGRWPATRRQVLSALSPTARANARLVALGYDAYALADAIQSGRLFSGGALDGASGHLQLTAGSAVSRGLGCAVVERNGLRRLPQPQAEPTPVDAAPAYTPPAQRGYQPAAWQ